MRTRKLAPDVWGRRRAAHQRRRRAAPEFPRIARRHRDRPSAHARRLRAGMDRRSVYMSRIWRERSVLAVAALSLGLLTSSSASAWDDDWDDNGWDHGRF